MRCLFCIFILNSNPTEPKDLLNQFSEPMGEDFLRRCQQELGDDENFLKKLITIICYCLLALFLKAWSHITKILKMGFRYQIQIFICKNFALGWSLIQMQESFTREIWKNESRTTVSFSETKDAYCFQGRSLVQPWCSMNFRKDFSYLILTNVKKLHKIAIATAMSCILSTLLVLGTIFHKRFGVPIQCFKDSCSKIKISSNGAKTINAAALIYIDEGSFINKVH